MAGGLLQPRGIQPQVPTTRQADVFLQTGSEAYQVHDLPIDTDLFLRLRVRAHARGAAGITDLRTALDLVRGRPFDLLRRDGWSWLTEGERYDLIIGHAVVDVAHTVFLQAMADGDHDLARHAATTGLRAVPEDETLRLDLVQLEHTLGDVEAADRRLREEVLGRDDHGLDGLDVPERTQGPSTPSGTPGSSDAEHARAKQTEHPGRLPDPRPRGGSAVLVGSRLHQFLILGCRVLADNRWVPLDANRCARAAGGCAVDVRRCSACADHPVRFPLGGPAEGATAVAVGEAVAQGARHPPPSGDINARAENALPRRGRSSDRDRRRRPAGPLASRAVPGCRESPRASHVLPACVSHVIGAGICGWRSLPWCPRTRL